ncbi:Uma2 family endonuclease [Candidatus Poribacteria bacterium]|nr:Uma2 family endonuclease [Candidatus Poribacteria bacterium]
MTTYTHERKISSVPTDTPIFYPDTDGKPMAASDLHRDILIGTIETLKARYKQQTDVYVSGDILMYYVEGDPHQVVAPDVLVSFGLDKKRRNTYLVWIEGKLPDFVMEFSSKTTYDDDLDKKMKLYASLGIQDYLLYDAEGLYLPSPLMGYTLVDGVYVPISEDEDGGIHSAVLSLDFYVEDEGLGLYDPVAEAWLQTPTESAEARAEQEAARAENAEARAEAAETEAAQLREQLERLQKRS